MKKLFVLIISLLALYQPELLAQCNPFYNFKEGTEFEMHSYNAKDKLEGRMVSKVKSFSKTGQDYSAVIQTELYDKKDKLINTGEYEVKCENGIIKMDMSRFIPEESMKAFEQAEVTVSGDYMELPSNLEVGKSLKDGMTKVEVNTGSGLANMVMEMKMENRKVMGKEKITTPAGTFDAFKISYELNGNTKMMGMNIPSSFKSVEYISEGFGAVRTESFNKKGKMVGYTVLASYK
ncbi:MAG: TapB family protein [Candidatus Cyclobacteriaceae bacterium M3_2C_046]